MFFADLGDRGEIERSNRRFGVGDVSGESSFQRVERECRGYIERFRVSNGRDGTAREPELTVSNESVGKRFVTEELEVESSAVSYFIIDVVQTSVEERVSEGNREI